MIPATRAPLTFPEFGSLVVVAARMCPSVTVNTVPGPIKALVEQALIELAGNRTFRLTASGMSAFSDIAVRLKAASAAAPLGATPGPDHVGTVDEYVLMAHLIGSQSALSRDVVTSEIAVEFGLSRLLMRGFVQRSNGTPPFRPTKEGLSAFHNSTLLAQLHSDDAMKVLGAFEVQSLTMGRFAVLAALLGHETGVQPMRRASLAGIAEVVLGAHAKGSALGSAVSRMVKAGLLEAGPGTHEHQVGPTFRSSALGRACLEQAFELCQPYASSSDTNLPKGRSQLTVRSFLILGRLSSDSRTPLWLSRKYGWDNERTAKQLHLLFREGFVERRRNRATEYGTGRPALYRITPEGRQMFEQLRSAATPFIALTEQSLEASRGPQMQSTAGIGL